MAIKFTNTKKWDDVWFSELTMESKVMFVYLCDMCDIAGFLEINERMIRFHTGIEDVRGAITSLSKSVIYRDGYIWIMKYIKHQKNLPLNPSNNAHKGIISSMSDRIKSFPEIFDVLSEQDSLTLKEGLTIRGYVAPSEGLTSPIGKGKGKDKGNVINTDTPQSESYIARLYKYFVGEENLMGESVTSRIRIILIEALSVMDVEEWKVYCEARLKDEYKAAPNKFFLEDGWRRYQDDAKAKKKEHKQADTRRKEVEDRKSLPEEEAPEEFKEFIKTFGKRSGKTKRVHSATP
jgi:hypothetical protein